VRIEYAIPRKKVETALQHYLKRISAQIKVHQAILFGSYAQDNYSLGSDIDIAIIADDLPSDPGKRFAMLKDTVLGLDLQPFAYTTGEWEKMLETASSFAGEIVKHGKVLVSREVEASRRRKTALLINEKLRGNPPNGSDSKKIIRYWRNRRPA
jgi:predicted nucleotidyltransferase